MLLVALLIAHPWTNDSAATDDGDNASTPADPKSDTVRVRRADYIGEPIDSAVSELRGKGFDTKVETKSNPGDQDSGTVADLSPTGAVEKGATITLQVWGDPPEEKPDEPQQSDPPEPDPDTDQPQPDPSTVVPSEAVPSKAGKPGKTEEKPGNGNPSPGGRNGQSAKKGD